MAPVFLKVAWWHDTKYSMDFGFDDCKVYYIKVDTIVKFERRKKHKNSNGFNFRNYYNGDYPIGGYWKEEVICLETDGQTAYYIPIESLERLRQSKQIEIIDRFEILDLDENE